ncbi:uncharacterized protein LOC141907200 [Tubulanus polymorphus]|uniref:uncharacterized protein LOC141907200 n=1 Tax=Tubulanus polymorphus TaxID=672921 RepID=UPI003DA57C55
MDETRKCHYDVLGLEKTSTDKEIRNAYVKLSKKLHPDLNRDKSSHDKFVQLQNAYSVLSNKRLRQDYDLSLPNRIRNQNIARNMAQTYNFYGQQHPSRHGTYQSTEPPPFWDETIWSMRDKSKDNTSNRHGYYGFRGVNRVSNTVIVAGCLLFIGIGATLHYFAVRMSHNMSRTILDERDRINSTFYKTAKNEAIKNGNERQLDLLRLKLESLKKVDK